MKKSNAPIVSIIMATYNRPDVLKYAIESVLWQTYTEWELIVVGDACNESTKDVIDSFHNSKIYYHNFKKNFGEQSKPNNWGIANAQGKYITFLNHDDLYFPDHLECLMKSINKSDVDVLYSMQLTINSDNKIILEGYTPDKLYTPKLIVPASSWLVKRSIFNKVGDWYSFKQVYGAPSQNWLFRAFHANCTIQSSNHIGVLAITSGDRRNSYRMESILHREAFGMIKSDSNYKGRLLSQSLMFSLPPNSMYDSLGRQVLIMFKNLILTIIYKFGMSPWEVVKMMKGNKKGQFINQLRQIRGLKTKN